MLSNSLTTISGIQTLKMPAPNKKMRNVSIYNVLSCFWGIIARISPLFSNFAHENKRYCNVFNKNLYTFHTIRFTSGN